MSGNKRSKRLIAAVLCMAMTGSILAYLPNEVSAQTSTEVVNGSFEVGYAGMDVYGWHLTAMTDELAEGIQTDANATVQSLEAYTLKTEESENEDRSKVAALTKYGKGTVAMTSQAFAITGGERYIVSYDAVLKDWTSTAPGVQVAVKEMTADGTLVKWSIPTTDSTDAGDMTTNNAEITYPTAEWMTINRTFDASENATQAELYIWVAVDDDMTGTILFDKVAVSVFETETEITSENPISSMMEGGDANNDSESNIDICDVIHMKKYLADEEVTVSDSADMNKNELVNEDDLTLLRWKLLGVTTTAEADEVGIRTDLSKQLSEEAQTLINSIYALPAVRKMEGFSGSSIEIEKLEFAKLNDSVKAKVINRKTLAVLENTYQEKYKMLYSMSDISAFSLREGYKNASVTLGSEPGLDPTYGNVLTATSVVTITSTTQHLVIDYTEPDNLAEQLNGYEKVCFYVYNGYPTSRNLMCRFGGTLNPEYKALDAGAWTKVEVPVSDFIGGMYFGIYGVVATEGTHEFKFSAIWAEKDNSAEEAQPIIDMIDALPKVSKLEGYHLAEILEVKAAYEALSEKAKAKVSNYAALTALENSYNEKYLMLYDMSDVSAFSLRSGYLNSSVTLDSKPGTDETYGNVLSATSVVTTKNSEHHLVIDYTEPNNLAEQLNGYEKVCFYVYNGYPTSRNLMCRFGGTLNPEYKALDAGAWTKVEVPVSDFIGGMYFGIYGVAATEGTHEFKFSAIWAESSLKIAQPVIDMIDSLPTVDEVEGYHKAEIVKVRAAYEELSDAAKAKVSNYATLTALESSYNEKYQMMYDMSDTSYFSKHSSYPVPTITLNTDAEEDKNYGNILTVTVDNSSATGDKHLTIVPKDLANFTTQLGECEKVCFYVYNGYTKSRSLHWRLSEAAYITLEPGVWTKVEVPVDTFIASPYIGIYSVGYEAGIHEFKFSAIWAEKALGTAQPVIDMIDALPTVDEVEGYHKVEIAEVRAAYEELSDAAKAKVSNYATLTALESSYNEKYQMMYDMSDTSYFSKHSSYPVPTITLNTDAEEDKNYGNILTVTVDNSSATGDKHLTIVPKDLANFTTQLGECEKVCFYVYNGYTKSRSLHWRLSEAAYITLEPGVWTKVEVPVDTFIASPYIGIYSVGYEAGIHEFKFSAIWAEKAH